MFQFDGSKINIVEIHMNECFLYQFCPLEFIPCDWMYLQLCGKLFCKCTLGLYSSLHQYKCLYFGVYLHVFTPMSQSG